MSTDFQHLTIKTNRRNTYTLFCLFTNENTCTVTELNYMLSEKSLLYTHIWNSFLASSRIFSGEKFLTFSVYLSCFYCYNHEHLYPALVLFEWSNCIDWINSCYNYYGHWPKCSVNWSPSELTKSTRGFRQWMVYSRFRNDLEVKLWTCLHMKVYMERDKYLCNIVSK